MLDVVLAIETSCDDTGAALVSSNGDVLSSIVSSQLDIHSAFGGIYPEHAARAHVVSILPTIKEALTRANVSLDSVKAIGVTRGPGLISSLLVGINTAIGLGLGLEKPVIGVNHLRGHLRSADLEEKRVEYPAMVLLVSGGHTILAYMQDPTAIQVLGTTRDDSVGETYDKVGRMLGLGFPGGPAVDKLAMNGRASIRFPRPMLGQGLEFSFSGLKSAVSRHVASSESTPTEDIAASFVEAVLEVLVSKSRSALEDYTARSFVIVGGVAASPQLRAEAKQLCQSMGVNLCLPPLKWSTDNAAMIGLATWDYLSLGLERKAVVDPNLSIVDY